MHGFAAFISFDTTIPEITFDWKPNFDFQHKHISREIKFNSVIISQHTSQKFLSEKLWIDNDDYFIVTEGIINNLDNLCEIYNAQNYTQLISIIYCQPDFFRVFSGSFSGLLFNKKTKSISSFTNQSGTKKVFYYIDEALALITSDLYTLSDQLSKHNRKKNLCIDASYLLLTSGFMHENLTLINEVKQLKAGEYCTIKDKNIEVKSYFNLSDIVETSDTKEEIIRNLDSLFKKAIILEFEIDKKHNYNHLTTLSGGLDSRMTALIAHKMGYKNQGVLNFSLKAYADAKIAKQIAADYKMELIQIDLKAESLNCIDEVVSVNDGLTIYTGSSHVLSALRKLKSNNTGQLHTGMIGDAVMGSFVSKIQIQKPNKNSGLYSDKILNKTDNFLNSTLGNYPTEELYKYYNRAFLGANNGFLFYDLIGESSSPFLDPAFLSYAYSIPRKYKLNERLYVDWIKSLHPEIASYTWELIGGKPTNSDFLRFIYRCKRAIIKRLPIKTMWKHNMNPEQFWYDNNKDTKEILDAYFNENIESISEYTTLMSDMKNMYNSGNITEKTQVLTMLGAYKLLF